ncbi:MAG TPA: DUF3027 domain-containing protein [Jatrophihabitans sp.]
MTEVETQDVVNADNGDGSVFYSGEPDAVLAAAVDLARDAAVEVAGPDVVGEHLGVVAEDEFLLTHTFASQLLGYRGWYWAVSLVRAPEADYATVADVVQLPGVDALLAPAWVPWSERLRPGDLGPGDLLPPDPADPRLVAAYVLSDDPQVESVVFELGQGRERVMSREGRLDAAERWQDGDFGPESAMARHAPGRCGACGFYLPLGGSLQAGFGACGNEISSADGHVVSVEYGCGAHSQAKVKVAMLSRPIGDVYDDGDDVAVVVSGGTPSDEGVAAGGDGDDVAVIVASSADAALPAVLDHEEQADQAEDEAVEAGPEPDAVAVVVEPAEEAETEHGEDKPAGGSE